MKSSPPIDFIPHPDHLRQSGLTLEQARALLRRPYGSLKADELGKYVLLTQTPAEREVWRQRNFANWRAFTATVAAHSAQRPAP